MQQTNAEKNYHFLLCLIIISILSVILYYRLERIGDRVEQTRIQHTLSMLRSAIHVFELSAIVSGEYKKLMQYNLTNPMNLMSVKPADYAGEIVLSSYQQAPVSRWYFDISRRELVYSPSKDHSNIKQRYQLRYYDDGSDVVQIGRLRLLYLGGND